MNIGVLQLLFYTLTQPTLKSYNRLELSDDVNACKLNLSHL